MPVSKASFINGPSPSEAPETPFKNESGGNPVLGGIPLIIASKLLASSTFIQQILWKLNGFDKLKELPGLDGYSSRYDPTVIPLIPENEADMTLKELSASRPRANDLAYYTTADYQAAYKNGSLSPIDVVEALLPLIKRTEKITRHSVAYISSKPDLVRAAAQASAERWKQGKPLSPLDGIPVAIKDEVDLKGYPKSLGSKLDFTPQDDITSWCVKKWEEAGAIVVGKTNMHELGLDTTNNNPTWGTPLNPHNEGYYTGGSSGGTACTLAQGLVPIALGVDGGGSIRIPAAFCGLWGIKPSFRRVSDHPSPEKANTVAVSGPLASNIDDLTLAYRVMAQSCAADPVNGLFPSTLNPLAMSIGSSRPKVLGLYRPWIARSDPEVLSMFDAAVSHHVSNGYTVVDVTIPLLVENQLAMSMTILSESMLGLTPQQLSQLSHPNQIMLNAAGHHATAQDFLSAQRLRDKTMRHLASLWEKYPGMLLLTPTTPCAGWKIRKPSDITDGRGASDSDMTLRAMEYTTLANWTGCPAISCPVGWAEGEVPVGIMAMGEWGSEEQLLHFGKNHESFLGEQGTRRPKGEGIWVDVLAKAHGIKSAS